ncbi:MAG TPA: glycosyltransferase [Pyrinomonadaceae bacterium]
MDVEDLKRKVSVCIPTFNGAAYLSEAITSVLNQTLTDFELIVVDDCSSDSTETVVKSFQDDRLTYYKNSTRLGLVGNWNRCLELAKCEYVSIFHQDDVMAPENLGEKIRVLDEHPSVGLVFSQAQIVDGRGNPTRMFSGNTEIDNLQDGMGFFEQFFLKPNVICCPSVLVRKSCYEKLGRFDARLSYTCDCEMWMRICLFFDIAYIKEPLLKYREHDRNESRNFYDHVKNLKEHLLFRILILDKFPQRIPAARELRRSVRREYSQQALSLANHHYSHGRFDSAKALLKFSAEAFGPIVKQDRFIRLSTKLLLGKQATEWTTRARRALQR